MSSPNKNKVRWVIVLGEPKLNDPKWAGRTPTPSEKVSCWLGQAVSLNCSVSGNPSLYSSKDEALKEMKRIDPIGDPYHMRVEKYVSRKQHP